MIIIKYVVLCVYQNCFVHIITHISYNWIVSWNIVSTQKAASPTQVHIWSAEQSHFSAVTLLPHLLEKNSVCSEKPARLKLSIFCIKWIGAAAVMIHHGGPLSPLKCTLSIDNISIVLQRFCSRWHLWSCSKNNWVSLEMWSKAYAIISERQTTQQRSPGWLSIWDH